MRALGTTFALAILAFGSCAQANELRVGTPVMPLLMGNPFAPVSLPQALPVQMIYDSLTRAGPAGVALPGLALSWRQETATTWAFKLAPDVVFSNGEPFNAEAVSVALAYLATSAGKRDSSASMDVERSIAKVTVRDALTVEIITREPDPILPLHLSFLRIPAPNYWQTVGRDAFMRAPIGTGPFQVTNWSSNRIVLQANPKSKRVPKVSKITVTEVPEPVARVQALNSGAINIAMDIHVDDREAVTAASGALYPRPLPNVNFMLFVTTKSSPVKDARVQQALNYAVDKERMIAAFLGGATRPASQFSYEGAFGFNPSLKPYPYDPAKAKALLTEAGFGKGFSFDLQLDLSVSGYGEIYQQIAQDLAAVGVRMNVRSVALSRIAESVQSGQWMSEAFGWTFAGYDSLRGYLFRSCRWHHPYHCDQDIMPLIDQADRATTAVERETATQAVLAFERERPPGIMLWRGVNFDGLGRGVAGYGAEEGYVFWDRVTVTP